MGGAGQCCGEHGENAQGDAGCEGAVPLLRALPSAPSPTRTSGGSMCSARNVVAPPSAAGRRPGPVVLMVLPSSPLAPLCSSALRTHRLPAPGTAAASTPAAAAAGALSAALNAWVVGVVAAAGGVPCLTQCWRGEAHPRPGRRCGGGRGLNSMAAPAAAAVGLAAGMSMLMAELSPLGTCSSSGGSCTAAYAPQSAVEVEAAERGRALPAALACRWSLSKALVASWLASEP